MSIDRRDFLVLVSGAAAGYAASRLPLRRLVGLEQCEYHSVPGRERWVRTACQICPGGCGMEVRVVDGSPVSVRGNPLHPTSRGGLCPVGVEALHIHYSPDRIKAPLIRVAGKRGTGVWKKVGWDSALDKVRKRLTELVSSGRQDEIYLVDGYGRGLLSNLASDFMGGLGARHYYVDKAPSATTTAMELTQGVEQEPAYDLENTRTLLSFGVPLLEGWTSPMQGQRAVGGIRGAKAEGEKRQLIHFDVRASRTANRADKFIQVKPGTFGAVALSIAYVLIRQNTYDSDFVENHCFGFEDWIDDDEQTQLGFKNYVLRECRPQDMEAITGVAARDILEIARIIAEERPALAIMDGSATALSNGVSTAFAIHALNALTGSIDRSGGSLVTPPVPWSETPSASTKVKAERYEKMLSSVREGDSRVSVLFLLHSNPFFSSPQGSQFLEALGTDTVVVSFSPLPDESTHYADVVLPDHSFLERWQDAVTPATFADPVVGITRPVSAPLYDTKHSGDVFLDLARTTVADGKKRFPWSSFRSYLQWSARGIFSARRGAALTTERGADEIRQMARRGWWIPEARDFDAFWEELLTSGGWSDPAYSHGLWGRVLRTPTRKFDFYSRHLQRSVEGDGPSLSIEARKRKLTEFGLLVHDESSYLPHFEAPQWQGVTGADALVLHLTCPVVPNTAAAASLPWVREILNDRVAWETWAELHPDDAARRGLKQGELIEISSDHGSFAARLLVAPKAQPGVIAVPYGVGRKFGGQWASLRGTNPNVALSDELDQLGGFSQRQGSKVTVRRTQEVEHA